VQDGCVVMKVSGTAVFLLTPVDKGAVRLDSKLP
jgi:hypothetical protein